MPETASIEALKVGYQQTKDGMKLTLVIHPDNMPDFLALAPIGQRIAFAAVLIDDETSEHGQGEKARRSWDGIPLSQQAAIRCHEIDFQRWVYQQLGWAWPDEPLLVDVEGAVISAVRDWCGVKSRADIGAHAHTGAAWREIDRRYIEETRLPEQRDGAA